ncbi:hypothetical protein [Acidithiobacillus sp.]|uniref:hypothetical protein n=1 Tax=Acidithiobacillus sp. TaxID=1872118 RepID=UPI0026209967|nr:hypothetical protein [Acidithiobacillus sp.]MDD5280981.1 hypothetical protein [Acidithiobacillus sp.]
MRLRLGIGLLLLVLPLWAAATVPQFFLVQNSGWMQPYFSDKSAQFPEILRRLVEMSCKTPDVSSALALFNQSSNPDLSPEMLYRGSCSEMPVRDLAKKIHAARLPNNPQVFANSDYRQALYRAIERYAKGQSAVFWMVTNNKNSPDNSQQLNSHDAAFYQMLHASPQITRVIAIPLPDGAVSKYFTSHGLIIFGIGYGAPAAKYLENLVASGDVKKAFGARAASLKPLNVAAVSFVPEGVTGPVSGVRLRRGVLNIALPARNHPQSFTITGRFINHFYPYTIASAATTATLLLDGHRYSVSLTPAALKNLQPDTSSIPVTLSFTVPAMPKWSLQTLLSSGRNIPAILEFTLTQQHLAISPNFISVINKILPDAPMPQIFQPDPEIRASQTDIPIMVQVKYPIWPLLVVLGGLAVLVAGILFMLFRMTRTNEKSAQVRVNGRVSTYRIAKGKSQKIRNEDGDIIAEIKRGFFGYSVGQVKKGAKVELIKK